MTGGQLGDFVWSALRLVGIGIALYSLRMPGGRLFVGSTIAAIGTVGVVVGVVSLGEPNGSTVLVASVVSAVVGCGLAWWGARTSRESMEARPESDRPTRRRTTK